MKRALMYASVASMIQQFNMENIRILLDLGYGVDVACNMEYGSTITNEKIAQMKKELEMMGVNVFHIPVPRKVTAIKEILRAYKSTKELIDKRAYSLIHCHSPIGGMICRIANRFSAGYRKTKMIYTAHGFHFYKGAPLKNWMLFYPVERFCARFTDVLITINKEDYALAQRVMKAKNVKYVPGIGINLERFGKAVVDKAEKRKELGIPEDAFLLLSVGEVNGNKNHETAIRAIDNLNIYYIIAGKGERKEHLQEVIDHLHISDKVHLLGFRSDVGELYKTADAFVFPSFREGLSVALMEAMACGLPVVCSNIRGNTDLINEEGGELFDPHSVEACRKAIKTLLERNLTDVGERNMQWIQNYGLHKVKVIMKDLYSGK